MHVLDVPRIHPHEAPRWLVGWLDGAAIDRADLVGHSLGGLICARTATVAPERVRRLALIAPAGVPTGRRLVAHAAPLLASLAEARAQGARVALEALRAGPALLRPALYAATHDLRADLAHVQAPTLLVWGKRDRLLPIRLADDWLSALPHARLLRLPSGHVPMWDAAEELTRAILDFLQEPPDELGDQARPRVTQRCETSSPRPDRRCAIESRTTSAAWGRRASSSAASTTASRLKRAPAG